MAANESNDREGGTAEDRNTQKKSAGTGSSPSSATGGVESSGTMGNEVTGGASTKGTGQPQKGDAGRHGSGSGIEGGEMQNDRGAKSRPPVSGARGDNQDPVEGARDQYGAQDHEKGGHGA